MKTLLLLSALAVGIAVSAQPLDGKTLYGYFKKNDIDLSISLYKTGWYQDIDSQDGGYSNKYFVKNQNQRLARVIDPISSGIIQYNYVGDDYQKAANRIIHFFEKEGFSLQSKTKSEGVIKSRYISMQRKELADITLDNENRAMGVTLNNVEF